MPELPEVETLRRELGRAVKGKTFKSAQVKWAKMVKPLSVASFQKQIKSKKILAVNRRAKILILQLNGGQFLIIHLKLTGQLIYKKKSSGNPLRPAGRLPLGKGEIYGGHPQPGGLDDLPNKFTHIIFDFADGSKLFFNDMRKFGWMRIVDRDGLAEIETAHGVEPLSKAFTAEKFIEIARRYPNRKIKQILLDQKLIAGCGNIYADESCFCAGIMPTRIVKKIKTKEFKKLRQCLVKILKFSISKGGTSFENYVRVYGQPGGFVPHLRVYGRKTKACRRGSCSGTIERIKVNGRGTHFCKGCQK